MARLSTRRPRSSKKPAGSLRRRPLFGGGAAGTGSGVPSCSTCEAARVVRSCGPARGQGGSRRPLRRSILLSDGGPKIRTWTALISRLRTDLSSFMGRSPAQARPPGLGLVDHLDGSRCAVEQRAAYPASATSRPTLRGGPKNDPNEGRIRADADRLGTGSATGASRPL